MEKEKSSQNEEIIKGYQCPHCGRFFRSGAVIFFHLLICPAQKERKKDKEK